MADNKTATILVELDILLDTRYGVIAKINPEVADRLLKNGYLDRTVDTFDGIDKDIFDEEYRMRDVSALSSSPMTAAIPLVKEHIDGHIVDSITHPEFEKVKLVVLTHPYELMDAEKTALVQVMSFWFPGVDAIDLLDLDLSSLTPQYCEDNFTAMFVYNLHDWLQAQSENFAKKRIPTIECISPALYYKTPSEEDHEFARAHGMEPFSVTERTLAPIIALTLIPVRFYSIAMPDTIESISAIRSRGAS